ncbi:MAG: phosphoribosylformylglycinamidine cyclo-ligase [Syntrophales bacterium]|jgi:phosphoribosylformylglycinamidine cyclo-ligase|nr:phosphoribosylformylglycinamidine cyclo-ligase [Syntrophales bacterium]NLN59198.1 phosphoribosylformylglycinamidine cyclo-ligase [Deltaproteobacteria bacterium]
MEEKTTYSSAGVDIGRGNAFVEKIRQMVKSTSRKEVMGNIGGFGGFFHLDTQKIKDPILVSSTDGVGTKLKIAQMMNRHNTVGIDLVAMSVNDVVVSGAEPLFFLDYIATGKISMDINVQIVEGIVRGCTEAGCALLGGETAEMPGFYKDDEYDLAGFCVGVAEADRLIDGSEIRVGDQIIGIASSGLHSNGYSLVRKVIFEKAKLTVDSVVDELRGPIGEELLKPTSIYVKSILNLLKSFAIGGIVHITGGGFLDNIPRVIPKPCMAIIDRGSWEIPPIFSVLQRLGNIDETEMFQVFNMGIGMVLVVPEKETEEILEHLVHLDERAYVIGYVDKREEEDPMVVFSDNP